MDPYDSLTNMAVKTEKLILDNVVDFSECKKLGWWEFAQYWEDDFDQQFVIRVLITITFS